MKFEKKQINIFVLSGKAQSGKNLIAKMIKEYYYDKKTIIISYGYYIKEIAKKVSNWDGLEDTKPRELLQQLGIELIKNKINQKFLINRMLDDIEILSYFYDVIIISDARLVDEIESLKEKFKDIVSIRVIRTNYDSKLSINEQKHITEVDLDNYKYFDYTIKNNNDYNKLNEDVNKILDEVKL